MEREFLSTFHYNFFDATIEHLYNTNTSGKGNFDKEKAILIPHIIEVEVKSLIKHLREQNRIT